MACGSRKRRACDTPKKKKERKKTGTMVSYVERTDVREPRIESACREMPFSCLPLFSPFFFLLCSTDWMKVMKEPRNYRLEMLIETCSGRKRQLD